MNGAPYLLQLSQLSVSYGPVEAVHQVDLHVAAGATLVCANPKARGRLFRPQVGEGTRIKNIALIADIRV